VSSNLNTKLTKTDEAHEGNLTPGNTFSKELFQRIFSGFGERFLAFVFLRELRFSS